MSYMRLERYEEAINILLDIKLYDLILSTQIYGAVGDCYSQLNNSEKAHREQERRQLLQQPTSQVT